ncbi:MAG: hypothetical protein K2I79_02580 [Clostridia bacterium]|nr:hypothetical protein [Clostridia bacterium]
MKSYAAKLNRLQFIVTLLLVFAMAISCFVVLSSTNNNTFAFTDDGLTSDSVKTINDLDDILLDGYADRSDGKVFKGAALSAIYNALTGKENSTLNDVKNLSTMTAAEIRAKNSEKDIVLTLDNREWTITHFTKDTDGNPIITLWLASATETSTWNNWYDGRTSSKYPSNMYSSSYVRAVALNSGTGYAAAKNANELTEVPEQDKLEHVYANLTMPKDKVKGSLTSYIVTPSKVAYQGTENQNVGGTIGGTSWTLPNEAYGTPQGTVKYYSDSNVNMSDISGKTGYSDWQNDYIWLPSLTETGFGNSITGIW